MSSDLRTLWQSLETENTMVSAEQIQLKAIASLRKSRRDLVFRLAFAIAASAFCILAFASSRMNSIRYIAAVVMAMVLANATRSVYLAWKAGGEVSSAASSNSCAAFYREQLERQQVFAGVPFWRMVAALGVIAWLVPRALRTGGVDPMGIVFRIVLLGAAGLVVLMAIRKYQARRVKDDLQALTRFEEENDLAGRDE